MKCLSCHKAELTLNPSDTAWVCSACKRAFSVEAVAEIERLRATHIRILGIAGSLAGYASTCKLANRPEWLRGLVARLNAYLTAASHDDRVTVQGDRIVIEAAKGNK